MKHVNTEQRRTRLPKAPAKAHGEARKRRRARTKTTGARNPKPETFEQATVRLRALPPHEYDRVREVEAKRFGVRLATLDHAINTGRTSAVDATGPHMLQLHDLEPWPDPVDGAELLSDLSAALRRHVVMPNESADAAALWILHSHTLAAFKISPRLAITSPEKRCGKTTLLDLLSHLVPRPLPTSNITAPALFRTIEALHPTLLIDEADTFLHGKDDLNGVLNSGHYKPQAVVIRLVGDDHESRLFSTWAPIAIAKIGRLPSTLEDRSVVIALRRRRHDEHVESFRADRTAEFDRLARKAARWARDHLDALRHADPALPGGFINRAADNWRPLLAIADAAGDDWPRRARNAAGKMAEDRKHDDDSIGPLLLADIRRAFEIRASDRISSAELAAFLAGCEEHPWPEWKNEKPITPRQVARLLNPFGISPNTIRTPLRTIKGYHLDQFSDAFARYLPPADPSQRHKPQRTAGNSGLSVRHTKPRVTDRNSPQPAKPLRRDGVTVRSRRSGEKQKLKRTTQWL
jgi:putative DNA primase/helicase